MSKLNPNVKSQPKTIDVRLAGGGGALAARQDNISLLRRLTLANLLWEDQAYVDGRTVSEQIAELIPKCEPVEVADLAIETRLAQKLRHTPLFIAAQMLKHNPHRQLVPYVLENVITRPDQITDFLAIYKRLNGKLKPLAKAAQRGLAEVFNKFNEYQFAKYDRNGEIKLRDAMFLVHPKPEQGKEELFAKIASRTLDVPDTWEVALSTGKDKKATWERLIEEKKLGALALLRNIRNMKEAGVSHNVIRKGLNGINSGMLLPTNFLAAIKLNPEYSSDIEAVMLKQYANLPKLSGKTLFVVDVSGSMECVVSDKSQFQRKDVAMAMALLAANQCEEYELVVTAGNDSSGGGAHEHIKNPARGLQLFNQIREANPRVGRGGIFTRQVLEWSAKNLGTDFDRIIVFSDSQDCDRINRTPKPFATNNYIVDVSSHQNGINYRGIWTAEISGWSEHFLTYIASLEGLDNNFQEIE
jgi:hypothetical protein